MSQNQFLPVATGAGANTLTPAQWAVLGPLLAQGFQSGVALSIQVNTLFRQLSTVMSGLAQFTADNQAQDVLDDGVPANFEQKFRAALQGALSVSSVHYGVASGTGDTMVVTASPPIVPTPSGAYPAGTVLVVQTPNTANATPVPTINSNGIGAVSVLKANGSQVAAGDIPALAGIILYSDGTNFRRLGLVTSDIIYLINSSAGTGTGPSSPAPLSGLPFRGYQILGPGTSGNWIPPAGVYKAWVRAWAGGGGSGGTATGGGSAASGAGSCGYFEGPYTLSATERTNGVAYVVGVGGAGGATAGANGSAGGSTSFGTWAAYGGGGSLGVAAGGGAGGSTGIGQGGQGINAPIVFSGSPGSPAVISGSFYFGGSGGAAPSGGGGAALGTGSQGSYPGGGAAGSSGGTAGAGGGGDIILFY